MVTGEKVWDNELIADIFEERDANLILAIPLRSDMRDSWYWKGEKLGHYSVKSAYGMLQKEKNANNNAPDNSGFWRKLWNLKVPAKVKNLVWRATTGCLPTKVQLRTKHVDVNDTCHVCNNASESIFHSLISCQFARACLDYVSNCSKDQVQQCFLSWLAEIFNTKQNKEITTIVMVLWSLWSSRNDLVWNQRGMSVTEVVESAKSLLYQWQSAQDKTFDSFLGLMTREDGADHWRLPTEGTVKVNTDAAIFSSSGHFSFSMVARSHSGELIEAKSVCRQGVIQPELAEAMGVREALSWVNVSKWPKVEVETDCLVVVQAVRSNAIKLSYLGSIVEECKQLLAGFRDQQVTLKFIKRSANKLAHQVARHSCSVADRSWRMNNIHPDFLHVLSDDLKV